MVNKDVHRLWLILIVFHTPTLALAQATDLLPPVPGVLIRDRTQPVIPANLPTVAVPGSAASDPDVELPEAEAADVELAVESETTLVLDSDAEADENSEAINTDLAAAPSVILMERTSGERVIINPGQEVVIALPEEEVESSADETLLYPLPGVFPVTSEFGMRVHPISGLASFHEGIDLGAPTGTPILAAFSGQVIAAGVAGGYGNAVVLAHSETRRTRYAHMSEILVSDGTWVNQGEVIGLVGSTGNSTGPHLHFEFWQRQDNQEWVALDISDQLRVAIAQR